MISVRLSTIANAKVIDNETGYVEGFVPNERDRGGSIWTLVVAVFSKVRGQAYLTQAAGLRESIHILANLEVDRVIVEEGSKLWAAMDDGGNVLRSIRMYS